MTTTTSITIIIKITTTDLLSPQDLMAVDFVPQLILAGVTSFKIEGRLKVVIVVC